MDEIVDAGMNITIVFLFSMAGKSGLTSFPNNKASVLETYSIQETRKLLTFIRIHCFVDFTALWLQRVYATCVCVCIYMNLLEAITAVNIGSGLGI